MNFIAIDFETANEKRNSPCSIGIVVIENGIVKDKIYYLIRPKEMRFMPINISIHGILPGMVKNEPEFDFIWEKIKRYFENSIVVAHNAAFDISVLRRTLETYNIEVPTFNYICTMKLAKNFYKGLENAKLSTVNRFLEYKFNHHDALADALASANILINIGKELKEDSISEISRLTGVIIGTVNEGGYTPSSSRGRIYKTSNRICSGKSSDIYHSISDSNEFLNQVVVFTGKLSSMTRDEASRIVRKLGGSTSSSVSRKTTILVTNMKDIELELSEMTTKLRKATLLKCKGQNINIINEDEFIARINKKH